MPAKKQITRDALVRAAAEMTREGGIACVNARALSARLGCSTQPIYGAFTGMDDLRQAVISYVSDCQAVYITGQMADATVPYKAYGAAYIRFAATEKEWFKALFMRDRSPAEQEGGREKLSGVLSLVRVATGLSEEDAYRFQMEMWFFIHGIASMLAYSYMELSDAAIDRLLTDEFAALRQRFGLCPSKKAK